MLYATRKSYYFWLFFSFLMSIFLSQSFTISYFFHTALPLYCNVYLMSNVLWNYFYWTENNVNEGECPQQWSEKILLPKAGSIEDMLTEPQKNWLKRQYRATWARFNNIDRERDDFVKIYDQVLSELNDTIWVPSDEDAIVRRCHGKWSQETPCVFQMPCGAYVCTWCIVVNVVTNLCDRRQKRKPVSLQVCAAIDCKKCKKKDKGGLADNIQAAIWSIGEQEVSKKRQSSNKPPKTAAELVRTLAFNLIPRKVVLRNVFTLSMGMSLGGETKVSGAICTTNK